MSGITLYGYHYGRVFVISLILFMFIESVFKKSMRYLRKTILFFLITLLVFSPFLYSIISNGKEAILRRPAATFIFSNTRAPMMITSLALINQFIYTLKGFFFFEPSIMSQGIENMRYLPILTPPIDLAIRLLFYAGLIIFIIKWKRFKIFYVILISVLLTEIFTALPPNFSRGLIYIPLIYLIASLTGNRIFTYLAKYSQKIAIIFFLLFTLSVSLYNTSKYFSWMQKTSLYDAREPAITYKEFPYWQRYQIERVSSGLNPITNYDWYQIRTTYLPKQ
jgi:hypothetical protein